MKRNPHDLEPRAQVVFRHTRDALRSTGLTLQVLANQVADEYQQKVSAGERVVEFHVGTTTDAIVKASKANLQLVTRFYEGKVKLPSDLEESWVAALPQPHRADCERELAQRYGFIGARAPASDRAGAVLSLSTISIEFAQTIEALAPILADGKVTEADLPFIKGALKETNDLMAELISVQARLQAVLPDLGTTPVTAIRSRAHSNG